MNKIENNIVSLLRDSALQTPQKPALVMNSNQGLEVSKTFNELWRETQAFSAGLKNMGIRTGDRIIIMIPMSTDLYTTLLGTISAGATAIFVDPWIGAKQIAAFSAFAKPTGFIGVPKSHILRLLNPRLRKIGLSITTGKKLASIPARYTISELLKASNADPIQAVSLDSPALITFTSGSSGMPKGANRTHGFLKAQHKALQQEFHYEDNDVDMPMFPVFTLNNIAKGITSIIPNMNFRQVSNVDGKSVATQIQQYNVSTITASPPFIDRLCDHITSSDSIVDFKLRRILTGGAPVTDCQLERWRNTFSSTQIEVVYGSTEAEPVAHINADERLRQASHNGNTAAGYLVGTPTKQLSTKIVTIKKGVIELKSGSWEGVELSRGQIGELVVSGSHVCKNYFNNPQAVAENKITDAEQLTWHRMGDTGYFDDNGQFWLTGRVHTTIIRNGELYHPQLIEQIAANVHQGRTAAVGIPDPTLGEKLIIVVEAPCSDVQKSELIESCQKRKIPVDELRVVNFALPLDPRHNSKIDYRKLREKLINSRGVK